VAFVGEGKILIELEPVRRNGECAAIGVDLTGGLLSLLNYGR
jgi:hypothetical protein